MKFNEVVEEYQKQVLSVTPYRMNLVDILGANENKHTKILVEMLRHNRLDGHGYLFLKSFVENFVDGGLTVSPSAKVESQVDYIDALIAEPAKFVIIIENKINWAADQKAQIEQYVKKAMERYGVDSEHVYAIYLTDDGRKKVSRYSLTEEAENMLGIVSGTSGRFIEMNYQRDILPWLERDVLQNCRVCEVALVAAIRQYVEYLRSRFGIMEEAGVKYEQEFVGSLLREYCDDFKRYEFLRKLLDDEDDKEQVNVEASRRLRTCLQSLCDGFLAKNYSIDYARSLELKSSIVRNWAKTKGFKPRCYHKDTTFFEFRKGAKGARIKFQVWFSPENNLTWVQFFNNDGSPDYEEDYKISQFKDLVELFKRLYPGAKLEGDYSIKWETEQLSSESLLLAFLNDKVSDFLRSFCAEFAIE